MKTIVKSLMLVFLLAALPAANAKQATVVPKPAKYDGCHSITLFDSTNVFMEESGLSRVEYHKRIQMLDYTGCRNNSVVKMDYDPLSAYVEIRLVVVHRHYSGKSDTVFYINDDEKLKKIAPKKRVDDDSKYDIKPVIAKVRSARSIFYDYIAPARLIYWGASQKMVEVGHLDPYDEVEIWSFRKGYTYALLADNNGDDESRYIPPMRGHFYDIVPFWSNDPVTDKYYIVNVLKSKKLQYKFYNSTEGVTIDSLQQGDRIVYTFRRHDIMPLKREPYALASNDMECKLLLSTAPNWQSKSVWFYGVNENYGSFKTTPEVTAKVRQLLAPAKNELDSISILTHWVADNIRYCGISMGEGEGYTLHNAQMNFTDRCGVCKDKAGMLVTMLRAAGFKSYAAMTMAGERIDRIPADQFNHSVCVVQRRNGQYQLLDPTWVPNVRELWSSAEQQQGYLMGLPKGADLMETPTSPAENHYLRITGKSKIKKDGTLEGSFTVTAEGQSDASVRNVFKARQSEWDRNMEHELLKVAPNAVIKKITHTDPDRYLEQPVSITYTYSIPDYAIIDGNNIIFIPLTARNLFSSAMSHLRFDTVATERTQPFSTRCSQLVEINETITLPAEYTSMDYGAQIDGVVSPAVNYGCGFSLEGNTLTFGESAMYNKRVYDASDWPAFRQAVRNQKKVASTPVILRK